MHDGVKLCALVQLLSKKSVPHFNNPDQQERVSRPIEPAYVNWMIECYLIFRSVVMIHDTRLTIMTLTLMGMRLPIKL